MSNESELKIKVVSVADTSGAEKQTEALKQLDITASKTANSIAVAQAKTEVAEKSASEESRAASRERAAAALKEIESREATARASNKASDSLKGLGKSTKDVAKLGNDLSRVANGLARGDLVGLAQAGGALKDVMGTLGDALKGGTLPALLAVGAGFTIFKSALNDNQLSIKRYYDEASKASDLYRRKLEENTKANAELIAQQAKDIQKIAEAYNAVTAASEKAYARQQKLDAAKSGLAKTKDETAEKIALSKATTPEQEAAIKQKFADRRLREETDGKFKEFVSVDTKAENEIKNAQEAQATARQKNDEIEASRREAKAKADRSEENAQVLLKTVGATGPTKDAQAKAKADKKAYDDLVKDTEENFQKNSANFSASQNVIDAATTTKEENQFKRDEFRETLKGRQADNQGEARKLKDQITAKSRDASTDPKELAELRRQYAALNGTNSQIGNLLNQDTKFRAPSQPNRPAEAPGYAVDANGKISILDRSKSRSVTKDGQQVALNPLTEKGKGGATRTSDPDLLAAINELPAKIAAAVAGKASSAGAVPGIEKAAEGITKSGDATVKAVTEITKSVEKTEKQMVKVATKERTNRERSGGG